MQGFYRATDNSTLVVIGDRYHYVFPFDAGLSALLASPERARVQPSFSPFTLGEGNAVMGIYTLRVAASGLDEAAHQRLIAEGFVQRRDGFVLERRLSGHYYQAQAVSVVDGFAKPYLITLQRQRDVPMAVKVPLTPITVAADGVMIIGGVALAGLYCSVRSLVGSQCFPGGL